MAAPYPLKKGHDLNGSRVIRSLGSFRENQGLSYLLRCECGLNHIRTRVSIWTSLNVNDGRVLCPECRNAERVGTVSPDRKLAAATAARVRRMYPGKTVREIAAEVGVGKSTVHKILMGTRYKNSGGPEAPRLGHRWRDWRKE